MTRKNLILIASVIFLISCKKDQVQTTADKGILYDTASFGLKVNVGDVYRKKRVVWGGNSNEIFVQTDVTDDLYQVDIAAKRADKIAFDEVSVTGRNFDNSSLIVKGRKNNVYGYYLYHLNDRSFSSLLEVEKAANNSVNVSGSTAFYDTYNYGSGFYFFDLKDKTLMPLLKKDFIAFSKTGKKTLLHHLNYWGDSAYVFDNEKKSMVDSFEVGGFFPMASSIYLGRVTFFDDEKDLVMYFTLANEGAVIINAKTKAVIQQFKPSVISPDKVNWSKDGTKLYYTGLYDNSGTGSSGLKYPICFYDLISRKETLLYNLRGESGELFEMYLSDDNKKLLYSPDGRVNWYIKQLQ